MKTYVFIVPTLFRIGSILRTDIYRSLLSDKNARTIVVSPFSRDESFLKEFPHSTHVAMDQLPIKLVRRTNRLRDIVLAVNKPFFWCARMIENSIVTHRVVTTLNQKEKIFRSIAMVARPFHFLLIPLFNFFESRFLPTAGYKALVREYRPDAVIMGTASEPHDIVWLALSRTHHIPAFVVDIPWSYIETRFFAVPRRAHYIMWNEKMRDQFASLYSFPQHYLHVTGCQRYDFYVQKFPTREKNEFFKAIGADPNKKLIVYFTSSDFWHPYQADVSRIVLEAIEHGRLPKDTQLLVRLGWRQELHEGYQDVLKRFSNVILQKAEETPNQEFPSHLLYYCDVSLSVSSSLTLDACILDKPVIFTGLTGDTRRLEQSGIAQMFKYVFLKEPLDTGGVRVSYDKDNFIDTINTFMETPSKDHDGRNALVKLILGKVDGYAGARVAETIRRLT